MKKFFPLLPTLYFISWGVILIFIALKANNEHKIPSILIGALIMLLFVIEKFLNKKWLRIILGVISLGIFAFILLGVLIEIRGANNIITGCLISISGIAMAFLLLIRNVFNKTIN